MAAKRKHMKRSKSEIAEPKKSRSDWARLDATTDDDIARQIASDPDTAPEFSDEMIHRAHWVPAPKKEPISFRVDPDVLAYFRSFGAGYQTRMNQVLRAYMEHAGAPPKRKVSESSASPRKR
jgi:uncharacterized protein (DUF4415 family)